MPKWLYRYDLEVQIEVEAEDQDEAHCEVQGILDWCDSDMGDVQVIDSIFVSCEEIEGEEESEIDEEEEEADAMTEDQ